MFTRIVSPGSRTTLFFNENHVLLILRCVYTETGVIVDHESVLVDSSGTPYAKCIVCIHLLSFFFRTVMEYQI